MDRSKPLTRALSGRALAVLASLAVLLAPGCGGDGEGAATSPAGKQVLRVNFGAEPPSLDPGLATDVTSFNVLSALMDPLVKLDEDLEPAPSLAERWEVSEDGTTVTIALRRDGKWTNGDPVTADDFEHSWKRTLSPELGADYAYQFYGIVGAAEYNACEEACERARRDVGVRALDDYTLEVRLTTPQPWFIQQLAHTSFLAVHRPTVEQYGDSWTEAENIVTNGPFRLAGWEHEASMTLEKWQGWRAAESVELDRVEGVMISDSTTALQAFEAGEFDACVDAATCIPPAETERLKETPEYHEYPALGVQFLGLNVENVPDLNQRRALAFAIDRETLVGEVTKTGEVPATSFTPKGIPGFELIQQDFLPTRADVEQAKAFMADATDPTTSLTFFGSNDALSRAIGVAIQDMWAELGVQTTIRTLEWAQYLEFLGPPPNDAVDAYFIGWVGDYVDAINFLELAQCENGVNSTHYCDPAYDRVIDEARTTFEDEPRHELYGRAEAMLTGPDGALPYIPLFWLSYPILSNERVQGWEPNLLDQFDWTNVSIATE